MNEFITEEFSRNPLTTGIIRSSIGYNYGNCARQLHYMAETNQIFHTQTAIKLMKNGSDKHKQIQKEMFPDMVHEYYLTRSIPEIEGINQIACTYDCYSSDKIIEIKPRYSIKAYVQTLIERFVSPTIPIYLYSYLDGTLIPLKADYDMSVIYVARIITALKHLPPQVPNAGERSKNNNRIKLPCASCMFQERCFSEEPRSDRKAWEEWTEMWSNPIVEKLKVGLKE